MKINFNKIKNKIQYYFSDNNLRIKPEIFFIIYLFFFGLPILFITPPYQSPDEMNHFLRAYQIAEGQMIAMKKDNRSGGEIPVSVYESIRPFIYLRWKENAKIKKEEILSVLKNSFSSQPRLFYDFPNTSLYSPIPYIPHSLAIKIGLMLKLNPLLLLYLSRIFSFLFWGITIFYSIKIIPIYKWLFTVLAILPMSLFINMSVNADVTTNSLAFLFIAFILKLSFQNNKIKLRKYVFIWFIGILLAVSKVVYFPILLSILIIPKTNFKTNKYCYIYSIILIISSLTAIKLWTIIMNQLYTPYELYNINFRDGIDLIKGANINGQFEYILHHKLEFCNVLFISFLSSFPMYSTGFIGTLGWLDTNLPILFIFFSYLIILYLALKEKNSLFRFKIFDKLLFCCIFFGTFILILISQHLTWDPVGGSLIGTFQGRYLIPIFPLIILIFYNNKLNISKYLIITVLIF